MRLRAVQTRAVQAGSAVQPDGHCIPTPVGLTARQGNRPVPTGALLYCLILWVDESISDSLVTGWESPCNRLSLRADSRRCLRG